MDNTEKKEKEEKDDPWSMSFKKDNWTFGEKSVPKFHVPDFHVPDFDKASEPFRKKKDK